jgi:hypothetical protein
MNTSEQFTLIYAGCAILTMALIVLYDIIISSKEEKSM